LPLASAENILKLEEAAQLFEQASMDVLGIQVLYSF
jgi:hypothetical protein